MIITKLTLENWCQHKHLEVEFSPKSNGILGCNGAGKTNLTKAIRVALTGRTDKGSNLKDEIRDGEVSTNIILTFLHNGVEGTIKRSFYVTSTNRASLTYGDIEVSGITETNKQVELLTGASNDMIEKFSFVGQDALRAILFDTPGKRLEQLISMIPVIAYTKLYRSRVDTFLKTIPEIAMPYDEVHVTQKHAEVTTLGAELVAQYTEAVSKLTTLGDCEEAQEVIEEAALFVKAETARAAQVSAGAIAAKELAVATKTLESIPCSAGQGDFDVGQATASLSTFDNFDFKLFETWTLARNDAESRLPGYLVATEEALEAEAQVRKQHEAAVADYMSAAALEATLKLGFEKWSQIDAKDLICPICGTDLQESELEQQKLTELNAIKDAGNLASDKDIIARDLAATLKAAGDWFRLKQSEKVQTESILAQADVFFTTTTLPEITTEAAELLRAQLENHAEHVRIEQARVAAQAEVTRLQDRVELLSCILGNPHRRISAAELEAAEAQVAMKEAAEAAKATLELHMKTSAEELVELTRMLDLIAKTKRERARVDTYRAHVNTVRDSLHRDRIPKAVLQYSLDSLRTSVNEYLEAFKASFSVAIDDGFGMTFTKGGGSARQLERMSGGEKTVLSISLHLAVSELFGNNLGVLVLDEPTSNMDVDYLSQFTQIIETLSSGILGGDRQLIVVTHQVSSMAGVFDKLIELGAQEEL